MKARGFKRSGLHRFECGCGNYTYSTVAAVQTYGAAQCRCGQVFQPGRVELAFLLGLEDCPVMDEYRRECSSVMHGQAWAASPNAQAPDVEAAKRLEQRRSDRARSNRLGALLPAAEPMPF